MKRRTTVSGMRDFWENPIRRSRILEVGLALVLLGLLLFGCGMIQTEEPDNAEERSIQLAREYVLQELKQIQRTYRYSTPSFRKARVLLLADILKTDNVFKGTRQVSTRHPKALDFLREQGRILSRLVEDPAAALTLLGGVEPKRRKPNFDRALRLFIRRLEAR